jgi:hypothetical protein
LPVAGVIDGKIDLWRWDEAKRVCVSRSGTPDDAARALASRWARDAYEISPQQRDVQRLYLAATLDQAAYQKGLNRPLDEKDPAFTLAKAFGPEAIDDVLEYAMSRHHPAAAAAAARMLGQIGKADALLNRGAAPAPLARALQQPDRRLRLAAVEAIVRLQPTKPFPGSSLVPKTLGFLAAATGHRRAMVASPILDEARDLAGRLSSAGYHADALVDGRELLLQAARSPETELILVDVTITRPEIGPLLQALRNDERTASLRVGLSARADKFDSAEHLAENDPMTKAFYRPHDDATFRW